MILIGIAHTKPVMTERWAGRHMNGVGSTEVAHHQEEEHRSLLRSHTWLAGRAELCPMG